MLPDNWEQMPDKELFFLQRDLLKKDKRKEVVLIGNEFRRRLNAKGLVKTDLGWLSPEKITRGIQSGAITDEPLKPIGATIVLKDGRGRIVGQKIDYTKFHEWLKSTN